MTDDAQHATDTERTDWGMTLSNSPDDPRGFVVIVALLLLSAVFGVGIVLIIP